MTLIETVKENLPVIKALAFEYGAFVLRISLAVVFIYFGTSQLKHPEQFIGWLPPEVSLIPLAKRTIIILNGGFETFFGSLLLFGLFPRTSALLLGGHLAGITFTIGWTEIGVRDFGLSAATLAIVLLGPGALSLDGLFESLTLKNRSIRDDLSAAANTNKQQSEQHEQGDAPKRQLFS